MSFKGNLCDLSAPDLMQYLHVNRRTGTLHLKAGRLLASIGFKEGSIVWAVGPGSRPLGDLLVEAGTIEDRTLTAALAVQVAELPRRSLAQVLIASGALTSHQVFDVIRGEIERIVHGLIFWTQGEFEFATGDLRAIGELALPPGEIGARLQINTEQVLLEAMRLSDELRRARGQF